MLNGLRASCLAAALIIGGATGAGAQDSAWSFVKENLYGDATLVESGIVSLEAPYRAEDAALVPMTIRTSLPDGDARRVERITLVIDENPAPVAATFTLGPDANVSAITTRVRVNTYTPVHVVATLSDGTHHVTEAFVKASGGCSAPMGKDAEEALANLGKMRLRWFDASEPAAAPMSRATAQLMIRHPNNSGLQMDQVTRFYIPAHFVSNVTVTQGDDLVIAMEGGISISEDPNFRFEFDATGEAITVEASDTDGNTFTQSFAAAAS